MARLTIPVAVRWSDVDGYGHVNNAAMLTLLEEARIAAFWGGGGHQGASNMLDAGPGAATATYIAHQEIEYLAPLSYIREPLQVEMWLARMGGASIDICYEVPGPEGVVARAMTTIVLVDAETGRARRITDAERQAWQQLVEEPVHFRRDLSR